jgi:roadblock/LC7 domain-containing protein
MKRLATAVIILLIAIGFAFAKDYTVMKKAGSYTVEVKLDKNPPITGPNKMDIAIKDAAGKDVTDAAVSIDYIMPPMPGMGAMNYKAKTELKKNQYTATLNFSMSGPWSVNIKINRGGKTQTVKLNVDIK